jgi:hypothetical protein
VPSEVVLPGGEYPEISMTYRIAPGRLGDWRGPRLAAGARHAVALTVGADGAVTEAHCALPCTLP